MRSSSSFAPPPPPSVSNSLEIPLIAVQELHAMASAVAQGRGIVFPPSADAIPLDILASYATVVRSGSYLIKYSRIDSPHERFFAMMLARQRRGTSLQTLLTCSLHANSSAPEATHDLSLISGVVLGAQEAPFQRFVDAVDPRWIAGPIVKGNSRAQLSSEFAFTVVFGNQIVCLLAASRPIYDGWIAVLNFLASIGKE